MIIKELKNIQSLLGFHLSIFSTFQSQNQGLGAVCFSINFFEIPIPVDFIVYQYYVFLLFFLHYE